MSVEQQMIALDLETAKADNLDVVCICVEASIKGRSQNATHMLNVFGLNTAFVEDGMLGIQGMDIQDQRKLADELCKAKNIILFINDLEKRYFETQINMFRSKKKDGGFFLIPELMDMHKICGQLVS